MTEKRAIRKRFLRPELKNKDVGCFVKLRCASYFAGHQLDKVLIQEGFYFFLVLQATEDVENALFARLTSRQEAASKQHVLSRHIGNNVLSGIALDMKGYFYVM